MKRLETLIEFAAWVGPDHIRWAVAAAAFLVAAGFAGVASR
jgi:hypothetical protein